MSFWTLKKRCDRILLSVYLNSLNSLPFFSVHTMKIGYKVSLSLAPARLKELLNMMCHKGQSWDLYSSASNDLPLHIPSSSAECHMLADDTRLHTTGKSVVQIKLKKQNKQTKRYSFVVIVLQCCATLIMCSIILWKQNQRYLLHDESTSSQTCHWDCRWMVRIMKM